MTKFARTGLFTVARVLALGASLAGAEAPFSQAVSPPDFAAAGLSKLSPEELARLDALVRAYGSGALEAAKREAAAASVARTEAERRAREAEALATRAEADAKSAAARASTAEADAKRAVAHASATDADGRKSLSLLGRAKVLLTPGTEIEYSTVESRIVGDFRGWERGTVFTLENGQRWRVESSDSYVSPSVHAPAVKITPGMLGSFFLNVEGVRPRAKVAIIGTVTK